MNRLGIESVVGAAITAGLGLLIGSIIIAAFSQNAGFLTNTLIEQQRANVELLESKVTLIYWENGRLIVGNDSPLKSVTLVRIYVDGSIVQESKITLAPGEKRSLNGIPQGITLVVETDKGGLIKLAG